eukprot:COSAG01_NODE_384_length_17775_cov_186.844648_2_plen_243_part_00
MFLLGRQLVVVEDAVQIPRRAAAAAPAAGEEGGGGGRGLGLPARGGGDHLDSLDGLLRRFGAHMRAELAPEVYGRWVAEVASVGGVVQQPSSDGRAGTGGSDGGARWRVGSASVSAALRHSIVGVPYFLDTDALGHTNGSVPLVLAEQFELLRANDTRRGVTCGSAWVRQMQGRTEWSFWPVVVGGVGSAADTAEEEEEEEEEEKVPALRASLVSKLSRCSTDKMPQLTRNAPLRPFRAGGR